MHTVLFHAGKEGLCFQKEAFRKLQLPYFLSINVSSVCKQKENRYAGFFCKLLASQTAPACESQSSLLCLESQVADVKNNKVLL